MQDLCQPRLIGNQVNNAEIATFNSILEEFKLYNCISLFQSKPESIL